MNFSISAISKKYFIEYFDDVKQNINSMFLSRHYYKLLLNTVEQQLNENRIIFNVKLTQCKNGGVNLR